MKAIRGFSLGLTAVLCSSTAFAQKYDGSGSPSFIPHTLQQALAAAYLNNPTLREERATLRATDEKVPTALAGWRPSIQGSAALTYYHGLSNYAGQGDIPGYSRSYSTPGYMGGVTITQPLYSGGKTTSSTHQAVNQVMAERAKLISTEEQVFSSVVQAYVSVVQDEQVLQLDINNEKVLQSQLHATEDRFRQGELTRTDVAQARAALATAESTRQQQEGTLQTAQATYLQQVGVAPAANLEPPQPLVLPVTSEKEVVAQALENNPNIIYALFTESADKDAVAVAIAALMPKVGAELAYQRGVNQGLGHQFTDNKYGEITFQIPIYQGGSEYAAVRQARQQAQAAHAEVSVQRKTAQQLGSSNWQQLLSYQAAIASNRTAVASNVVALDGVERQAVVGTSTTFEVLQQQETLLQAQVALVQSLGNLVNASYQVAAAIGRLTASDLKLDVPLYDEKAYYKAVKNRLWGLNDYAVGQSGR